MKKKKDNAGILKAIEVAGSQKNLADLLGVDQPLIHYYIHNRVPATRAMAIEKLTGVSKSLIRPDLWKD